MAHHVLLGPLADFGDDLVRKPDHVEAVHGHGRFWQQLPRRGQIATPRIKGHDPHPGPHVGGSQRLGNPWQQPRNEVLWAQHNMLSSLPDLSANTALQNLLVFDNRLSSLPDLSANTALIHLWAYGNRLSSLPDLSAHTALQQVRVGYIEDRSIVSGDFLGDLPSDLLLLLVEGVPLSANDLATIKATTGLRYLFAGGTGLSSTEVDGLLDGLPAGLQALALDGNDLDGVTWSKLSRLSSLTYLDVTGANLDDTAASAITVNGATGLATLRMGYNGLTAVPSLSRLGSLATLYLDHNLLTDAALGAGALDGPTASDLTVRVEAGNAGVTHSRDDLETTFPDVTFENPEVRTSSEDPEMRTSLKVTKQVRGRAPGGVFEFSLTCVKTGETGPGRVNTFTVVGGETGWGPVHAPGLLVMSVNSLDFRVVDSATCTLTEPGSRGATPSGLFTDQAITVASKSVTVTKYSVLRP